jgi:hypothetical protein
MGKYPGFRCNGSDGVEYYYSLFEVADMLSIVLFQYFSTSVFMVNSGEILRLARYIKVMTKDNSCKLSTVNIYELPRLESVMIYCTFYVKLTKGKL